jgi:hypothetical protein
MRRFGRLLGAALSVGAGVVVAPIALRVVWSWPHRVAVTGHSMEPTLLDGDWLLVDPDAYLKNGPAEGDLVVSLDPRLPSRMLVKRVAHVDPEGYLALAGDHPAHRHVAGHQQPDQILVPPKEVLGRPWLRYWPFERFGLVS